jgi:flagellar hook-associated protein 2
VLGVQVDAGALLKDTSLRTAVTAGTFTVNGVSISVDPNADTLTDVLNRIQTATGVTATLVNDAEGRPNKVRLTGGSAVTLGAGGDTSNFLTSMNLIASPAGTTRESTLNLGVTQTGALLGAANLRTAFSETAGSFKINGVEITYDTTRDSLNTVLSRINGSSAGVTATYDGASDRVSIAAKTTGSTSIQFQDVTGNFLDVIGVRTATQTLGKNAQYQVDTGAGNVTYYSNSNTVTNALPGVTFTLLREGAQQDTVTVGADVEGAASRVRELVSQFNSTLEFVRSKAILDPNSTSPSPVAGDSNLRLIMDTLPRLMTNMIDGVSSGKVRPNDAGISFGAVGSAVGTTKTLSFDESKFKALLQSDPASVVNIFSGFKAAATMQPASNGSVQSMTGDPTTRRPGTYSLTSVLNGDGSATVTSIFTPTDGGSATTVTATVAAGATNATLVPGVTLTMKGALVAGVDTITVTTPTRGLSTKLSQFIEPMTRDGGVLDKRQESGKSDLKRLEDQVGRMNERMISERLRLEDQFARMEQAMARMRSQQAALARIGFG